MEDHRPLKSKQLHSKVELKPRFNFPSSSQVLTPAFSHSIASQGQSSLPEPVFTKEVKIIQQFDGSDLHQNSQSGITDKVSRPSQAYSPGSFFKKVPTPRGGSISFKMKLQTLSPKKSDLPSGSDAGHLLQQFYHQQMQIDQTVRRKLQASFTSSADLKANPPQIPIRGQGTRNSKLEGAKDKLGQGLKSTASLAAAASSQKQPRQNVLTIPRIQTSLLEDSEDEPISREADFFDDANDNALKSTLNQTISSQKRKGARRTPTPELPKPQIQPPKVEQKSALDLISSQLKLRRYPMMTDASNDINSQYNSASTLNPVRPVLVPFASRNPKLVVAQPYTVLPKPANLKSAKFGGNPMAKSLESMRVASEASPERTLKSGLRQSGFKPSPDYVADNMRRSRLKMQFVKKSLVQPYKSKEFYEPNKALPVREQVLEMRKPINLREHATQEQLEILERLTKADPSLQKSTPSQILPTVQNQNPSLGSMEKQSEFAFGRQSSLDELLLNYQGISRLRTEGDLAKEIPESELLHQLSNKLCRPGEASLNSPPLMTRMSSLEDIRPRHFKEATSLRRGESHMSLGRLSKATQPPRPPLAKEATHIYEESKRDMYWYTNLKNRLLHQRVKFEGRLRSIADQLAENIGREGASALYQQNLRLQILSKKQEGIVGISKPKNSPCAQYGGENKNLLSFLDFCPEKSIHDLSKEMTRKNTKESPPEGVALTKLSDYPRRPSQGLPMQLPRKQLTVLESTHPLTVSKRGRKLKILPSQQPTILSKAKTSLGSKLASSISSPDKKKETLRGQNRGIPAEHERTGRAYQFGELEIAKRVHKYMEETDMPLDMKMVAKQPRVRFNLGS